MRKQTELKKYQDYVVKNGVAHILFHASEYHDIIHPFSIKGYEMLSDDFLDFIEKYRIIIPKKVPVVLEISGVNLTHDEKACIENTVWSHLCLNMTNADLNARSCIKRAMLYLLYTVLSAVLLFAVKDLSGDVITNLAYIPFWFFGYRLLIYLIIDDMPLWKQRQWYRQLASMKVVFSHDDIQNFENISVEEMKKRISEYHNITEEKFKNNRMVLQYIRDKGIVELGCTAETLGDVIHAPGLPEREFMSAELSDCLSQAEPFLSKDSRITFEIQGKAFNDEEQSRIKKAIKNYYRLRIAEKEKEILNNNHNIRLFAILIFVSAIFLACWGMKMDIAMHEFILMGLWFFGDYLLEFILIDHFGYKKSKKILENCKDMEVKFNPTQPD